MNAPQMVCHLIDALRLPLGDIPCTVKPGPLSSKFARWLIISVLPIPPARTRTTREFRTTAPGDWSADVATLTATLDRFCRQGQDSSARWNVHPTFGELDRKQWGKLAAKHVDHHLRQFGV